MSESMATTFSGLIGAKVLEIGDGYRAKLDELGGDGPIFLRAGLLTSRGIEWNGGERFRSEMIAGVRQKLGFPGDTMVTTKGNGIGRAGYVSQGSPTFVYSPHLSYWRSLDRTRLSSGFLRYWVRSPEFLEQLSAMAGSTDMAPYLSLSDQRRLRISLPEIRIQDAIGETLGALDDKIAVNDRIIDVSGSLLSAQYVAGSEGAKREVRLGELIELKYGKALKEEDRTPGQVPVFGGNGISGWHSNSLDDGPGVIVGRKGANAGSVSWSQGPFWAIDTSFYVQSRSESIPLEFLYFLLANAGLRGLVGDSAIPGLNREIALSLTVRVPSEEAIQLFAEATRPQLALAAQISNESYCLAQLRDTLLPKLMSGEIRVREAEKVVGEVT